MSVITVDNLKYKYPGADKLALDGISFEINKGDFIGIVGANGAGKSTLTQAIIGLVPQFYKGAYGGRVTLHLESGEDVDVSTTPVSTNSSYVGLVFQNPFNQLSGAKDTVYDEVAFGLMNLGVPRDIIKSRIEKVLNQLDIYKYKDRNPFDLSGGQMQRVAIASILVMEPEIIILDEPTSQLDPQGSEEVFKVVEQLKAMGMTVIMVEQKLEHIAQYCNKVLLMHEGKVVAYDSPDAIFSKDDLENLGVLPPAYTRICKEYDLKNEQGLYPSTLEGAKELFMKTGRSIVNSSDNDFMSRNDEASNTIFEVSELDFSYNESVQIFDKLNIKLTNRPTAIIGQNGAGKTTLVRILKGLLKPSGGNVTLNGEDISKRSVASLAGKVGYVFQNPDDQIFKSKVIDEVMFGPINIGMNEDEAKKRALEAISLMGLSGRENQNPYDLELYERKMVAIASVVAMDTDVLILDEPTIAQDYAGRNRIAQMIRTLSEKGKLVIAILHDMDFVCENFEHIYVMAHGNILMEGDSKSVFSQDNILNEAKLKKPYYMQLLDEIQK